MTWLPELRDRRDCANRSAAACDSTDRVTGAARSSAPPGHSQAAALHTTATSAPCSFVLRRLVTRVLRSFVLVLEQLS